MIYKPRIVLGKVVGTWLPIDGHTLYFASWDYEGHERWHLYRWDPSDSRAVMETIFLCEMEAGICEETTLEAFREKWVAAKWFRDRKFTLRPEQVEIITVIQQGSCMETESMVI